MNSTTSLCRFYKTPKLKDHVDYKNVTFSWDTSCYQALERGPPKLVDIYLFQPSDTRGQIYLFQDVDFESGSFQTELQPWWWGSKADPLLQISIVPANEPLFLAPFSAGPVFTTTFNATAASSAAAEATSAGGAPNNVAVNRDRFQIVTQKAGITKGGVAAAVIFPILIALGAIIGYIMFTRRREATKRQQWAENVDKRMSTISQEWQSMSAAGAAVAARNSYHSSNRLSGMYAGARGSAFVDSTSHVSPVRQSLYNSFAAAASKGSFASEDLSQLGPRARALSAAAAEGRPLSTLVREKELTTPLPELPSDHPYANTGSENGSGRSRSAVRPAPNRTRTVSSSTSNNPYAAAMNQRKSQTGSSDGHMSSVLPAHSTSALPRPRLNSTGRSADPAYRNRVTSRVSFVDVPQPSVVGRGAELRNSERGRHLGVAMPYDNRSSRRRSSVGNVDSSFLDMDSYPALALMRTQSNLAEDYESPLTPSTNFLPGSRAGLFSNDPNYFRGEPRSALEGRTPDEMMKAYAAAMSQNEKAEANNGGGVAASLFSSVRRLGSGLWRR